ncbi:MAG TPA: CHASE3 domain-containing protein [Gaiellaceae bacterium]
MVVPATSLSRGRVARRVGLTGHVVAAAAVLLVCFVVVFGILLRAVGDLRGSVRWTNHSSEVLTAANRLQKDVLDLEASSRGFVITRDEKFLRPWVAAQRNEPGDASTLVQLVRDNPAQERRARAIAADVEDYLREWSIPVVQTARVNASRARALVAAGGGKDRSDRLRGRFAQFVEVERRLREERRARSDAAGHRATVLGIAGLAVTVLLIGLFIAFLVRLVARPVSRVAGAAARMGADDLSVRVPERGIGEILWLARAFNTMATSLERDRDMLEEQHAELEMQQATLQGAYAELADEKGRLDAFYGFAEELAAQMEFDDVASAVLGSLAAFVSAPVGALYVAAEAGASFELTAVRGLDPAELPRTVGPHDGLAGVAIADGEMTTARRYEARLRLHSFGREVSVAEEVHIPLRHHDRTLGLVSLGRLEARDLPAEHLQALQHLAHQAAVALSNALAVRGTQRQAALMRAVLDTTREAIWMVDPHGRPLVENRANELLMHDVFGLPAGVTETERAAAVHDAVVDPDEYEAATAALRDDPTREAVDHYTHAATGRSFVRYSAPVTRDDGTILGRIFVLREVTAEREAERLKEEFVALVSHELRTPLTAIRGYLELLAESEGLDDEQQHFLSVVERNSTRLLRLVGDLLFVAQAERGGFTLERAPLDLSAVARDSAQTARPAADAAGVELDVTADASIPFVGDAARLGQLLDNLVSNAIKFTPAGGRVAVHTSADHRRAVVEVSDTGSGISPDEQRHLFTRFFRTRRARADAVPGTGLGLAIAMTIAQAHGGTIEVDSRLDEGTMFRVLLPLTALKAVA